jgi:AsmA protein
MYKWLALIVGGLLLLVVGITLFVKLYLTGELLAAWITPPLEHYLHRDVTLADASIGLRGFRVEGLEVRKEGASGPLLKGERLDLRWKFKELFKGRIVIHTLAFSKPEITLIRHEDGSLNIADLLPQQSLSEPGAHSGKRVKSTPSGVPLLISLLSMEDGSLTLVDRSRQPQATLQIDNIQARVNDLSTTTPVPFEVQGQIKGVGKGSITINGTFDLAKKTTRGNLNLQGIDLANLNPFFTKKHPDFIQQGKLTLEVSLAAEDYDHFSGKGSLNLAGLKIKKKNKLSENLEVKAGFQLDAVFSKEALKINSLDIVLNGHKADFQGLLTQWRQRPRLDFTLTSPQIKIDELLALLPKSPPPGTAKTAPKRKTSDEASSADKSEQKVSAEPPAASTRTNTANKSEETPKGVKAGSGTTNAQQAVGTDKSGEPTAEKSTEPLSLVVDLGPKSISLDAQGEIHLGWFFYKKLIVSNVDCQLKLLDGKLQVQPLSATVYGGELGGSVKAQVESPGPPFNSIVYAENVLLDEIIAAFWPSTSGMWSGNVNQISRASGIGSDLGALKVRTDLNINEAKFSGHPLLLKLAELFQAEDLQQLRFSQVTARILTSEGVATIKRLHLVGPVVQAEGHGTAGLQDMQLDLRLILQIRAQYVGKIKSLREIVPQISDDQGFVRLPLKVSGSFDDPVYGLDERWLAKINKKAVKKPLKKPEKKVLTKVPPKEKDKGKLKEELQKLVQ